MPDHAAEKSLARQIGERLRRARLQQRKQQRVVAGLAGITTDYLYQIERGLKLPSLPVLVELVRVLKLPLSALLGEAANETPVRQAQVVPAVDARERPTSTFLFDAIPAPGSVPFGDRLYTAMTSPGSVAAVGMDIGGAVDPAATYRHVTNAWQVWQQSPQRYSQLGVLAPALVAGVEQQLRAARGDNAARHRRELAAAASDLYGLLRSFCKRVGRIELSLLSAERAIHLAEQADDPVRLAAARWNLAHVLLADGQVDAADEVAMTAAETVRSQLDDDGDQQLDLTALYGALLLVGSMAAVRAGDAWEARTRVDEAARTARLTGERNVCWTVFGPTNVAMHAASIELVVGEAAEGLHLAERVDHRAAVSIERRISFLLDQAEGWRQRRDNAQVLLFLLEAEREAPEDLRYRPLGRALVQHLVARGRRGIAEQAAQLAGRLGLPV